MSKIPEELAEEYALFGTQGVPDSIRKQQLMAKDRIAFLAGFKAGREMSEKEIFDYYLELRKKHGQEEPEQRPVVEKFSLTLVEKKGFF